LPKIGNLFILWPMLVTTLAENFSKALTIASRFVGGKVQLPVLANILLKTDKNKLVISATNLETSISISIGAKIEEEGEITVPGKTICDLVNSLPSGQLTLKEEKEKVLIKTPSFESTILAANASDYPSIPDKGSGKVYSFPSEVVENVIKKILFSVSSDETRPVLTGVLLILRDKEAVFVSTDGFRLSQKSIKTEKMDQDEEVKLIIPKNTFSELVRISEGSEKINFSFNKNENQIIFTVGDCILSSRIIQGDFPDFEKIIPKNPVINIDIDKEELIRSVKLASVFAREAANVIKVNVLKNSVDISAESTKSGNQKSVIDAKVEGDSELLVAYNYRFIEEFLGVVGGESVKIGLTDANIPGIFLDPKDLDYLHIIMPIKLTN